MYYTPIASEDPQLKGWAKGAKDVRDVVRRVEVDDEGQEVVLITKIGK